MNLALILEIAALGCRVFPVAAREKTPLVNDWPNQATDNSACIEAWAKRWPDCNWGCATGAGSGFFAVDFDGKDGKASLSSWCKSHGQEWTRTRAVKTPRGFHVWLAWPDGETRIRNSAGKLGPGVDIRGEGGYVIVPPSIHPSGEVYKWLRSETIAPAPEWLLEKVIDASGPTHNVTSEKANTNGAVIPAGQRNAALASLAGTMRRRNMDSQSIYAALKAENESKCYPPLPDSEVRQIAQSVSRYAPEAEIQPITISSPGRPDMSGSVLDGRLGEICQTRLREIPLAYAWPALVTAAGALIPRAKVGIRTNLYSCLVGPKGSGKSSSIETVHSLLGMKHPVLLDGKYGSAEGLIEKLQDAGPDAVRLLLPDELGHLLAKASIDKASFPFVLNTAFYKDVQSGGSKGRQFQLDCRLSISAGLVEDDFGDAFGVSTTGGLYDRFVFGLCPQPYQFHYRPFEGPIEKINPFAPEVDETVWEARSNWVNSENISPRVAEHALRVATICAAVDGRPALRATDLGPALAFAQYQMRLRRTLVPNEGETLDARCGNKVRAWLNEHAPKGEWVSRRDLDRGIHSARYGPVIFNRCLNALAFNDEIELDKRGKNLRLLNPQSGENV